MFKTNHWTDRFYNKLIVLCEELEPYAAEHEYVEYVHEVVEQLRHDSLRESLSNINSLLSLELSNKLTDTAETLVRQNHSAAGVRIALDWIALAPRRLHDMLDDPYL